MIADWLPDSFIRNHRLLTYKGGGRGVGGGGRSVLGGLAVHRQSVIIVGHDLFKSMPDLSCNHFRLNFLQEANSRSEKQNKQLVVEFLRIELYFDEML